MAIKVKGFKKIFTWLEERVTHVKELLKDATDEDAEKVVADAILDAVETLSLSIKRPSWAGWLLRFAASKFRKKYNIPEYDS